MRKNSNKIPLDKYYTPSELAKYVVNKTKEVIGEDNISEYIEPSAGAGVFLDYLDKPYLAYDIEPEDDRIIKQDYLELDIEYKKGRCIIGNPPFGNRNALVVKFFKKSIQIADYVAFILPISQYKNTQKMYEFDLIYTEDLGLKEYSSVELHCCFNIYRRPKNGLNKTPPKYDLDDVEVIEFRRGSRDVAPEHYDFGMCTWGDGSCGKEIKYIGQYAQEHYIIIKNEELRDEIIKVCRETNWRNLYPSISSAKLQTWKIYKHFRDMIPNIK